MLQPNLKCLIHLVWRPESIEDIANTIYINKVNKLAKPMAAEKISWVNYYVKREIIIRN